MKKIIVVSCLLILPGLSSFAGTNAVPSAVNSPATPQPKAQKTTPQSKPVMTPSAGAVSHDSEIQPVQNLTFQRIERENGLAPRNNGRNLGAMFQDVFQPSNPHAGPTQIRDTYAVIYPTGR